jgi:hypothetical protein
MTRLAETGPPPVSIEIVVTVSKQELADQFGDLVANMGQLLADQVLAAEAREKLGYFPALSHYHENRNVDVATLDSALHIYFMVRELTGEIVRASLRTLLRNVDIDQIQAVAETLPRVRPAQADARHRLARHYTPSAIRLHLSAAPRETANGFPTMELISENVNTLLAQRFARVEIVHVHSRQDLNPRSGSPI